MAGVTSSKMKAKGRNVARMENQINSKKSPISKDSGGGSAPYGGGTKRGIGGQTKSKTWKGVT